MSKIGECVLRAVKLVLEDNISDSREAWKIVLIMLFGKGTSSQIKGCPKSAFLGLCEERLVKGVKKVNIPHLKRINSMHLKQLIF